VFFYRRFIKEMEARGVAMFATEFNRSNERQRELKAKGVSKAGPGASPHNYGLAVDIVHLTRLWDLTEKEWDLIGTIGKEVARKMNLKVEWGGDWNFYDPAHWEIRDWREVRDNQLIFPYGKRSKLFDFRVTRKSQFKLLLMGEYAEIDPVLS